MKKQIILGMTTLMFAGMMTNASAESTVSTPRDVPVSYDNRNAIVDPDNPNLAEWGVSIPTAVAFTKDAKTQNVDIELLALNGAKLDSFTSTFAVKVKAKSTNGMTLNTVTGNEKLSYGVVYGQISLSGTTEMEIASLSKIAAKQTGTANLATNAKPTKLAMYNDTLTYTIQKAVD